VVVGLLTYQQYGVNWDDPYQREIGLTKYKYVTGEDTALHTYEFKEYGPAYELLLLFVEKALGAKDTRDIFLARHLVTHLFFLAGAWCLFLVVFKVFKQRHLALFAFLLLLLSPRIYAHSFFNTKDVPFLSVICMALLAITTAFLKPANWRFMLAGVVCGFATSTRILGVMLPALVCGYLIVDIVLALRSSSSFFTPLKSTGWFLLFYCLATYAFFPLLWERPIESFAHCFSVMSHYQWYGTILQSGHFIYSYNIPWHVFFVWFGLTTPVIWLLAGSIGVIFLIGNVLYRRESALSLPNRLMVFYLFCFSTPIVAVIALHSVINEDWRHLFFTYPSFVLLGVYLLSRFKTPVLKNAVALVICIQAMVTCFDMHHAFPLNGVYFNRLVTHQSEYLRSNYEMDYWGVGHKQAIDHILTSDDHSPILLSADRAGFTPLENNVSLLSASDRARVKLVGTGEACDYFLTDFRTHPKDYDFPTRDYSIRAYNSTIIGIYKSVGKFEPKTK
jgi:hypothetical protein